MNSTWTTVPVRVRLYRNGNGEYSAKVKFPGEWFWWSVKEWNWGDQFTVYLLNTIKAKFPWAVEAD